MAQRYNTRNPRPSNSMKDLNDNALAYDDFLNGEEDVAYDRFQNHSLQCAGRLLIALMR